MFEPDVKIPFLIWDQVIKNLSVIEHSMRNVQEGVQTKINKDDLILVPFSKKNFQQIIKINKELKEI